jgi:3,4-dihydroxyphenylacetate 2,3-dioxygenase
MGGLVLAAKITHVPSIWLSEQPGPLHGIRRNAIDGLVELGRRARARGVETFVVLDVHWQVTLGFHVNAKERHQGAYTSHEVPHFIDDCATTTPAIRARGRDRRRGGRRGPALSRASRGGARPRVRDASSHAPHEPRRHAVLRVLPIAVNVNAAPTSPPASARPPAARHRRRRPAVALLASGSLSHRFWPNDRAEAGLNEVSSAFNREVDLRVLEMWRDGRIADFLAMLPEYARHCAGEAAMGDTAMLFGALGWERYRGRGELLGEYFGSSGTGQCNVDFTVDPTL